MHALTIPSVTYGQEQRCPLSLLVIAAAGDVQSSTAVQDRFPGRGRTRKIHGSWQGSAKAKDATDTQLSRLHSSPPSIFSRQGRSSVPGTMSTVWAIAGINSTVYEDRPRRSSTCAQHHMCERLKQDPSSLLSLLEALAEAHRIPPPRSSDHTRTSTCLHAIPTPHLLPTLPAGW